MKRWVQKWSSCGLFKEEEEGGWGELWEATAGGMASCHEGTREREMAWLKGEENRERLAWGRGLWPLLFSSLSLHCSLSLSLIRIIHIYIYIYTYIYIYIYIITSIHSHTHLHQYTNIYLYQYLLSTIQPIVKLLKYPWGPFCTNCPSSFGVEFLGCYNSPLL